MADDTSTTGPAGQTGHDGASNASATPAGGLSSPTPQQVAPGVSPQIAKILQELKIPERRKPASEGVPTPSAPPTIAKAPVEAHAGATAITQLPPQAPNAPRDTAAAGMQDSGGDGAPAGSPSPVVSLHTMKTDLQDVVREQKMSAVRAASMEADKQSARQTPLQTPAQASGPARTTLLMAFATLILLGVGAAAVLALYTVMHTQSGAQAPASPTLLFAENQLPLPISNRSQSVLKKTLTAMLAQAPSSVGSITQVVPVTVVVDPQTLQQSQRPATLSEFLNGIGAHPLDDLMRALSSDFFFGIHAADVPAPVFVIPVVSYDRAFAGMLAWEGTMDSDLGALFRQVPAVTAGQDGLPAPRQFVDLVVRNYDARALKDDTGAVVLYYSFPTPNLLIIAASPYTFPEVLSRLQAERKL